MLRSARCVALGKIRMENWVALKDAVRTMTLIAGEDGQKGWPTSRWVAPGIPYSHTCTSSRFRCGRTAGIATDWRRIRQNGATFLRVCCRRYVPSHCNVTYREFGRRYTTHCCVIPKLVTLAKGETTHEITCECVILAISTWSRRTQNTPQWFFKSLNKGPSKIIKWSSRIGMEWIG